MMLPAGLLSALMGALGDMSNAVDAKRDAKLTCQAELGMNVTLIILRTKEVAEARLTLACCKAMIACCLAAMATIRSKMAYIRKFAKQLHRSRT